MKIRYHHLETEGDVPVVAVIVGDTLHLMLNELSLISIGDHWLREALLDRATQWGMEPRTPLRQGAQIIDLLAYLDSTGDACPRSPSKTIKTSPNR